MVDVFVASAMATDYPYKLQKPSTISDRVRNTAETFILDSGIGDDVSNQEVLDLAVEYNADYIIAKDYLHDIDATIASTQEFVSLYRSHESEAVPMCPLQPDYTDHYKRLTDDLRGFFDHYVLGGMAVDEISTTDRIQWVQDFHDTAPEVYTHGLGVGGGMEFVSKVAGKGYLDSIDCASPEMAATHGELMDTRLRRQNIMAFPGGEGRNNRTQPLAEFNSWQVKDVWDRESECQTCLAGYENP